MAWCRHGGERCCPLTTMRIGPARSTPDTAGPAPARQACWITTSKCSERSSESTRRRCWPAGLPVCPLGAGVDCGKRPAGRGRPAQHLSGSRSASREGGVLHEVRLKGHDGPAHIFDKFAVPREPGRHHARQMGSDPVAGAAHSLPWPDRCSIPPSVPPWRDARAGPRSLCSCRTGDTDRNDDH
jgi:hypothetical protein